MLVLRIIEYFCNLEIRNSFISCFDILNEYLSVVSIKCIFRKHNYINNTPAVVNRKYRLFFYEPDRH